VISVVLVGILFGVVLVTSDRIAEANKQYELIDQVRTGVSKLDLITYDYLLHREKRMKEQWESVYDSVAKELDQESIKSIYNEFVTLDDLFLEVDENY